MTLENNLLKETSFLTSTENKYLLEDNSSDWQQYSLIRILQNADKNELTSTRNDFLQKSDFNFTHRGLKRKKKKKCGRINRPIEMFMSREIDGNLKKRKKKYKMRSSCSPSQLRFEYEPDAGMGGFDYPPELDAASNALAIPDSPAVADFTCDSHLMNVPQNNFGQGVIFGSHPSNIALNLNTTFGGHPLNSTDNFCFGAAPVLRSAAKISSGFAAPMLRSAAKISSGFPEKKILEMPVYSFESEEMSVTQHEYSSFSEPIEDNNVTKVHYIKLRKVVFVNAVSMALMCSANLKSTSAPYRMFIQNCADDVRQTDPEFILKVALYARQELNIRSVSNFLLSYAAYHEDTRQFLEKYFQSTIVLPSDWLEVADFYQTFNDKSEQKFPLPASLRRAMKSSFKKFDEYQLAKYNRSKQKKTDKQEKNIEGTDKNIKSSKRYTLKQMIRILHIDSPANEVMCLLGKKYPENPDDFKKSGLTGIWNSKLAGKRMKLAQPMTWETQISANGNKSSVWEALIDANKLPYMAMLRNLRNLILSGISPKYHDKVLNHLQDKNAVINCRQVPLQFYEAYLVINKLEEIKGNVKENEIPIEKNKDVTVPWKKTQIRKISERIQNVSVSILDRYKSAVNKALEISALHNLHPIPGRTLIICDVFIHGSIRKNKIFDLCILMGLMCFKACEHCNMSLIYDNYCKEITFEKDEDFLQVLMNQSSTYQWMLEEQKLGKSLSSAGGLNKALGFYLKQQTVLSQKLDHLIYLRASQAENHFEIEDSISSFLNKYRQTINPDLLYTDVNLTVNKDSFSDLSSKDPRDIYLHGCSPQLIKFIAERSSDGQLSYIDGIDVKYNLKSKHDLLPIRSKTPESKEEIIPSLFSRIPKWHTVRIFISSTFKDMHSERDVLIRYVIPELRKRAASVFVKINEVDLRWGINETNCTTKRAAELCLHEAQKSDLFIGILGERYGTIYNFGIPDSTELQWIKDYPEGLSITELEIHAGVLREEKLQKNKGFFYFRSNNFLSEVPEKWKEHFASENNESKQKVEELKLKIRSSGAKVLENYSCHFAGIFKGNPILSGLDFFGKTVLEDLWQSINQMHEKDPYHDGIKEEENYQQTILNHFDCFLGERNGLADRFLKKFLKEQGMFLISGASGAGKTTFVVNLLEKLKDFTIIKFFIGLTPKSTDLNYMLQFIAESIERKLPVSEVFPKSPNDIKNNFPDILQEATKSGNGKLVIVLDGLDHLETDAQTLDWLPVVLPDNLRLIVSASYSSPVFKMISERQQYRSAVYIENLTTLPQSDRETIIRHYLNRFGKTLDESSFNNQMLHIVTKKDSGIPLYLRLVCDYLRTYASFENFTSMLQNIPTSMPLLFQEIIIQMENEYTSSLIQAAFTLLCIAKEGLEDRDLHLLLSIVSLNNNKNDTYLSFEETVKKIKNLQNDNLIPQISFYSLFHLICTFTFGYIRSNNLNLMETEIEKAVKKYYLNKNSSLFEKNMHFLLAAYYYIICDPEMKEDYKIYSRPAFRALLYHLFHGKCFKELVYLMCNLEFLKVVFKLKTDDVLLEYYTYLIEKSHQGSHELKDINVSTLKSFKNFISRNMHILQSHPELILQQALNEPPESLVRVNNKEKKQSYLFEYFIQPNVVDHRLSTLTGFMKPITAVACHERKTIAALGTEDGYLKILDFSDKKIIRNLKNHASAITFICFGGKNRICTASKDGTLNIWSSEDYSLISTLKGHRRCVSCCCSDPSGSVLFSCGWDNSIRLWSLRDGGSISIIDRFSCPVNCIDHHPMKQQIACGLWNGNLEIWDTVSLRRLIVSTSQSGSIKSLAFSPDGLNIISAFINSEVAIWSSESGFKLSSLTGHTLPVKSIIFSYERNLIVSGSQDCTLKIWPMETGLTINTLSSCKYYTISMLEIISRDYMVICLQNSEIWIMNMYTDQIVSKFSLPSEVISCISKHDPMCSVIKDIEQKWLDTSVVLGTESGKTIIANFETTATTDVIVLKSRITALAHNAAFIICGNSSGDIGVFSFLDNKISFAYGAHPGSVTSVFLFEDLCVHRALSSGNDRIIKSWFLSKMDGGTEIVHNEDYTVNHKDGITSIYYIYQTFEGIKKLITGSHDNTVIVNGSELTLTGLKTSVLKVCCMDKYIMGCGIDGSIAVWYYTGKLATYVPGIDQSSAVLSFFVEKAPNATIDITLAYVDKNGTVKITKPIQKSYSYSLEGHSKSITSCCINRNGEILSSSLDGTLNFWKIDVDVPDSFTNHKSSVTSILLFISEEIMISSDTLGNIIVWKLHQENSQFSANCIAKKGYTSGFIKAMTLLKEKTFISAVTQIKETESHFLDIINLKTTEIDDKELCFLEVAESHHVKSEILYLDACSITNTIVASLKSGEITIIKRKATYAIDTYKSWITSGKLWFSDDSIEYLFICPMNGPIKRVLVSEIHKDVTYGNLKGQMYLDTKSLYITTFYCKNKDDFYCGDTEGNLSAFKTGERCKIIKVHSSSITGIVAIEPYIFTSSLDKTVKVFMSCTLQQIGMFYASAPITCLVVKEVPQSTNYILGIGTQSGSLEMLKFYPFI